MLVRTFIQHTGSNMSIYQHWNLYRQQTPLYNAWNRFNFKLYEKWHGQQNRFYKKEKSVIFQCELIEYIPKA